MKARTVIGPALFVVTVLVLGIFNLVTTQEPETKSAITLALEMDKRASDLEKFAAINLEIKTCNDYYYDEIDDFRISRNCQIIAEKALSYEPLGEAIKFARAQNVEVSLTKDDRSTYGRKTIRINVDDTPEEITKFLIGSPPPASGQLNTKKSETD